MKCHMKFANRRHLSVRIILRFITSILKSMVILAIWLALSSAIYSQIALLFALNHIFFSANENKTVKQNNQSDLKAFLTNQSHCKKMKDKKAILCCFSCSFNSVRFQNGCIKVAIELRVVQFWSEIISNQTLAARPFDFEITRMIFFFFFFFFFFNLYLSTVKNSSGLNYKVKRLKV